MSLAITRVVPSPGHPRDRLFLSWLKGFLRGGDILASCSKWVIRNHSPIEWEWQLRDEGGIVLSHGLEETRAAAKYKGARALFHVLLISASQRVL
jgi:hypothetical protein